MRRLTTITAAVAISLLAQVGAAFAQNKNQPPPGPQEQPGPFGFPGHKSLGEKLMASAEQEAAIVRIYGEYKKQETKLQQEQAKEAQQKKSGKEPPANAPAAPDAGALKGNMIMEIRMILNEEQKKKFQEIVDDMNTKKKKKNN